jgi:mRNA interferase HicA
LKYRELARKLQKLGCEEVAVRGKGAHRGWYNPATNLFTTIPYHGGKDLKTGLVWAALKQLGIDREKFEKV